MLTEENEHELKACAEIAAGLDARMEQIHRSVAVSLPDTNE